MQEVFQADAGEELGADSVGYRRHHLRSVVGRIDVAAERPRPGGQGDDAGDLVRDLACMGVFRRLPSEPAA